jgi:hypothetical protein
MAENDEVTCEAPAEPTTTPTKTRGKRELDIKTRYTTASLDPEVHDIAMYEAVRAESVDSSLAFLNATTERLEHLVEGVYVWMTEPTKNPFKDIAMPRNIGETSLTALMQLLCDAQNAVQQFAEIRSILDAVVYQRTVMHDRRKTHALINEGNNEQERKGLSALRSDPELLLLTRVVMAKEWAESRYYAYGKMVDSIQALMTTKSIEMHRSEKDIEREGRSQ